MPLTLKPVVGARRHREVRPTRTGCRPPPSDRSVRAVASPPWPSRKICGIETEYGIVVRGAARSNPISASSLLINAYLRERGLGPANGSAGTSRTSHPATTPAATCAACAMAPEVETHLVNAVLTNGARYYVDHAHPEFSTPECPDAREALLVYDRAGEEHPAPRSMAASQHLLPEGQELVVYKNNSRRQGQQLRLPRELPDGPGDAVRSHRHPRHRRTS